jgi:hypothetical protein
LRRRVLSGALSQEGPRATYRQRAGKSKAQPSPPAAVPTLRDLPAQVCGMAKACSDAIDPKGTSDLYRPVVLATVIEPVCRHIRLHAAFIQVRFDDEWVADHVRNP